MPTQRLTPQIINAAILGFEEQKRSIDAQIAELRAMLPSPKAAPDAASKPARRKRRKLSAAGRANIVAALKKRWAAKKAAKPKPVAKRPDAR